MADVEPIASFRVVFDEAEPISINKAYCRGMGGRVTLSAEGRAFKAKLSSAVSTSLPWDWGTVVDRAFSLPCYVELRVTLLFPDFRTKAWAQAVKKAAKGGSERITTLPYQKKDGSNYLKLIEDAVSEATGIDDSFHLDVHVAKNMGVPGMIVIDYKVWPVMDGGTHGQ